MDLVKRLTRVIEGNKKNLFVIGDVIPLLEACKAELEIIQLDNCFMRQLRTAAEYSTWIPEEYMMNDWINDCQQFLLSGKGAYD